MTTDHDQPSAPELSAVPAPGIVPQEDSDTLASRIQDNGPLHKMLVALDGLQGGDRRKGKAYGFDVKYSFIKDQDAEGEPSVIEALVTMTKGVKAPEVEELTLRVDLAGSYKLAASGRCSVLEATPDTANDAANLVSDWARALKRPYDLRQFDANMARRLDEADAQLYITADKIRAAKPDTRLGKPV